ncbi:MAG: AAA family ATPase [Candidatus Coproplasma sp.]
MSEKILITSLKGGAGATACAVGISLALASAGERTLLFDGDYTCASALAAAGVAGLQVYTLAEAKSGACRVKQAVLQHPRSPNFYLLPSLGCDDKEFAEYAVNELEGLFDYVICDKIAEGACDRAIVITDPYPVSVKCADVALGILKDSGLKSAGIIVNKVNGGLVFDGEIMTPQEIATLLRAPLIAVIPEDLTMPLGKMKQSTVKAFKMAAAGVAGKSDKCYGVIRQYVGVGGLIKRKMRSRI